MRKINAIGLAVLILASTVMAGGIVTNTNQSAQFIRTLNRNASTCIDAVYFNPAGLTKLEDGIYFALHNQSIFQTKEVVSSVATLNEDTFTGDVSAPLFPNIYVAYKTGNLAFSGGFMPIGGGGSADYAKGLPSFEEPVSALVPGLAAQGVNDYSLDAAFEGSSIYLGGQFGVSYKLNDMFSFSVGARLVSVNNTYLGHLKDIMINPGGSWMPAATFFSGAAAQYTAGGDAATAAAAAFTALGMLDSAAYYTTVATVAYTQAAVMTAYAANTADKELDAAQTGTGFTAVIGANISPMDGLNIGIHYEHLTKLEVTNETEVDDVDMFPDGEKVSKDMPAMLAVGAAYEVTPQIKAEASFNYYMNTGVDWGGSEENLDNGFEGGAAVEYAISDALKASAGFLYSMGGATDAYQNDLDYSLNSTTVGLGAAYAIMPNLELNVGLVNTFYMEGQNEIGTQTYTKTSIGFAVGVNYRL